MRGESGIILLLQLLLLGPERGKIRALQTGTGGLLLRDALPERLDLGLIACERLPLVREPLCSVGLPDRGEGVQRRLARSKARLAQGIMLRRRGVCF